MEQIKYLFIYLNIKLWNSESLMKKWIFEVYKPYTNNKANILVLDDANMHKTLKVT